MRERYRALVGDDRVALVRNFPFITAAELRAARESPHPLGGHPYVLHTGGASKLRAFRTMVETAEVLRERGCDWPIVNLGPVDLSAYGDDASQLLSRAAAADVRNIGFVSQETAWSYVAHASIGYMPLIDVENNRRGMPNKLFENLLFGLPIVATDLGTIAAVVRQSDSGLLVPPGDARAHAGALLELAQSQTLRNEYAERARIGGEQFAFDGELIRLQTLYAKISLLSDTGRG
jgi:glycosyltransferase involved in cell wall biosynthesis